MIAALFVATNGCYFNLPGVDPWDEKRDARLYAGPWPVVAHPPCSRWCKPLAWVNQTRYGHKVADDGGCFAAAWEAVRKWGGVLEHPAESFAWQVFGLPRPPRVGWGAVNGGGWVCSVSQRAYGHLASKQTWLYVVGQSPPDLDWSRPAPVAIVSGLKRTTTVLPRLYKKQAAATPPAFRDLLLSIARTAQRKAA